MMSDNFPEYKKAKVEDLIPYARNSRTHSDDQITKIASSIKEFGFLNPIITDGENGIVAGHGRLLAAKKLGLTEVPVMDAKHLTKAQRQAYVIADNRLALDAGWDDDLLKVEMQDLSDMDFDLTLTGFDLDEINTIFDGWTSDLSVVERAGENLDGIISLIKIKIDQDAKGFATETIENALQQAGIEYDIG